MVTVSKMRTCEGQFGAAFSALLSGFSKLKHTAPGLLSMANAGEWIQSQPCKSTIPHKYYRKGHQRCVDRYAGEKERDSCSPLTRLSICMCSVFTRFVQHI